MAVVFMTDPATGRCALFDEPSGTGDADDPNSARNAPLNSPATNLAYLYFHSDYDPMEVVIGPTTVTISHATIAAGTGPGGAVSVNGALVFGGYTADHLLVTHSLGYVPDFFLLSGSNVIHPGYPIQFDSADGRSRCVTAYANTTQIRLHEFGIQTSNALAGLSVDYDVMVLKAPPAAVGDVLLDFDPGTGIVQMAREKFSSDRKYLQIVAGGSPFGLPLGRTIDLANGTFRSVSPDGTIRDVVPATFRISFGSGSPNYGPDGDYNGSFTGDPSILAQAP